MASYFDEIARNKLKSIILMLLFGLLFFGVILIFTAFLGGGLFGLIFGAIIIIAYALFTYFAGDKLVLKVSRAQEADRKQYATLYNIVEELAAANQIPVPKVYTINDPSPNAFATGRDKKHASIAVTTGLLSMMDRHELEGVIAHETSHILDNDILFMLVAIVFAGSIGVFAAFIRNALFFGFGFGNRDRGNTGLLLLAGFIIGLLAPLFALLIRLAISRRREYMADANGARITREPAALASALKKIERYDANPSTPPARHANEITSSLYFSNPFKAQNVMNLFSTHPPIGERIKRLQKMY